jgi:hypothetical protein
VRFTLRTVSAFTVLPSIGISAEAEEAIMMAAAAASPLQLTC